MIIDRRLDHIPSEFKNAHDVAGGQVWRPDTLVDLQQEVSDACVDEEDDEIVAEQGIFAALREWGYPSTTLITFLWDSLGPCTWEARIQNVRIGDDIVLAVSGEFEETPVFARIAHRDAGAVLPGVIEELLRDPDRNYDIELFGGLPTMTENSWPGVLPESLFRRAYRAWVDGNGDWDDILNSLRSRIHEPDQVDDFLRDRNRRNGAMTESNKDYIIQFYFRLCYEEFGS